MRLVGLEVPIAEKKEKVQENAPAPAPVKSTEHKKSVGRPKKPVE